jgi:hypothetical protein
VSTGFRNEPGSREPGLDQLIRALTADGYPQELAGRETALAAFRSARRQPSRGVRLTVRPTGSARLGAVAAAAVATLAGLTAAAYAQALPAPMQRIAYSVFSSFGVPDSQPRAPAHSPASPRSMHVPAIARHHGKPSRSTGAQCPCPARTPRPAIKGSTLTLAAARTQFPANGWDAFTGRLTHNRHPEHGVRLVLLEQTAGGSGWRRVGSGITGPRGGIRVGVPHLTQNASFELASPDGAVASPQISVTVIPHISFWRASVRPGINRLVAQSRFGDVGDVVVLEELTGGAWQNIASQQLDAAHRASFDLPLAKSAGHYYRAVLQASSTHGASVSVSVHEPPGKTLTGAHVTATPASAAATDIPDHHGPYHGIRGPIPTGSVPTGTVSPGPVPPSPSPSPSPSGTGSPGPIGSSPVRPGLDVV